MIRDFSPEHADPLSYFVPEALGHLDTMTRCLLALEQGRDDEDNAGNLFRAVHTLKGAAYVIGQTRVGDIAHRIEEEARYALATVPHVRLMTYEVEFHLKALPPLPAQG